MDYAVTDPATGETLRRYPTATDAEIDTAVTEAADCRWREVPMEERAEVLRRVAARFRTDRERLAAIATTEMGKPTAQALGEIDLVADIFDYYADRGPAALADREIQTSPGQAVVRLAPVGVLLGIMPWNYPYYQIARFSAPNLLLGNTVLLKPAPSCPESAAAVDEIFADAGLTPGAHRVIRASTDQVARIIDRDEVQGVSLTGSERAGRAVAALAGAAGKKVVLELGGSDAFIVLADADLDRAVRAAVMGRMQNAGQACTASKRFIVERGIYEEFLERFTAAVSALRVGDPTDAEVDMGPLSSEHAAQGVQAQVDAALAAGARAVVGGTRLDRPGAFVAPTVLVDVPEDAPVRQQEIFGPVAMVIPADDAVDAVRIANETPYGLGGVVYGSDRDVLAAVVDGLDTGMVAVNGPSMTQPDTPFGGVKASGFGRELAEDGLFEFANRKLIRTLR